MGRDTFRAIFPQTHLVALNSATLRANFEPELTG
jgi:hypothetical protein